jgi:hypothetical protein
MYFKDPIKPTDKDNLFYLAPIPIYMKEFGDDELQDEVFRLGLDVLNEKQKLMGQELPDKWDESRQSTYKVNYQREDRWVEPTEYNPIGSRFFTPPNNFLDRSEECVRIVRERCNSALSELLDSLDFSHNNRPIISESWMQYYEPTSGRGHNQHNHCDWGAIGAEPLSFVGGYYLSDGEPLSDHPYSGALCFHIRGMSHFIRPKKGMLLIWPYDIIHSVKPFYGKSERCVINFNIQGVPKPNKLV